MNRFHVLLAVNRALHDEQFKLKTLNIESEIAFSFGINNNVSRIFKQKIKTNLIQDW